MPTQQRKSRKVRSANARIYRFDARLNEEQKRVIQRAADLEGRTLTDFVLSSARAAAEQTIERRGMMALTARESEAFAEALVKPPEAGRVLRKAAREYLKRIESP